MKNNRMTDEEIEAIRGRCGAATEGPWQKFTTITADQYLPLAREAVACDGWRWIRGIPAQGKLKGKEVGLVCLGPCGEYIADFYCLDYNEEWEDIHVDEQRELDILPDFDHPLAVQSLLVMVREAWGDPTITTVKTSAGWEPYSNELVTDSPVFRCDSFPTEIEALVAALKAGVTDD